MNTITRFTENLAPYGDFSKIKDINSVIDDIIKSLSIKKGTYVSDPEVGSELFNYDFDLLDEFTLEDIKDEIKDTLSQINNAKLENIELFLTDDKKGIVAELTIEIMQQISKVITIVITKEYVNLLSIQENI